VPAPAAKLCTVEEIEDHGKACKTRFKLMRERIEAMKAMWTKSTAE
jgi:hypothetical protein